ncbi:hypothetical protein RI367_000765 [Sorochytrium milnesiophthora]
MTAEEAYSKFDKPRPPLQQRIVAKGESLVWVFFGIGIVIYTDLLGALRGPQLNRTAFALALASFTLMLGTFLYLELYLPRVKKMPPVDYKQWHVFAPRAIPFATASGVAGGISLTVALWPIYGIFTPGMLLVLFMAFLVTLSLI